MVSICPWNGLGHAKNVTIYEPSSVFIFAGMPMVDISFETIIAKQQLLDYALPHAK
jgi:hypothetical protein